MALPIYTSAAFTGTTGVELAPNASVEVRSEADDSLVTLYEDRDGNSQINNPFQADAFGRFQFFANPTADGWRITVTSGADSHMLRYQQPMGSLAGVQAGSFMMDFVGAADAESARDTLGAARASYVDFLQEGGVADDVTDNYANFATALTAASGKTLYIPAGTYRIELDDAAALTPGANTRIVGDGRATVLHIVPTAGAKSAWTFLSLTNAGVTIEDLVIDADPVAGDAGQFILLKADDLTIRNCEFDGGHTAANETTVHLFAFSNADAQNIRIEGNEIHNWRFGLLKANTDTSIQRTVKVLNNFFHNNYANDLAFNTPSGVIQDIVVQGNTFYNNQGGPTFGTFGIMCGMASATDYKIVGNTFLGTGKEAIHLEEHGREIVVTGNTFKNDGKGVVLVDNSVSGSSGTPSWITISGNAFSELLGSKTHNAIECSNDGGADPAEYLIITGNTFRNYGAGVFMVETETIQVFGNTFYNCAVGVDSTAASPNVERNHFVVCDTALDSTNGGAWGFNTYEDVTTTATVTNGEASLMGWRVIKDTALPASQTSNIILMPSGFMANGFLNVHWHHDSLRYRIARREIDWDGTTLTDTAKGERGSGAVAFSGVNESGGNIRVALNNTDAVAYNGGKLQAEFDGIHAVT